MRIFRLLCRKYTNKWANDKGNCRFSFRFSAKDKASGQHIAAIVTASNPVKTAPILGTGSNYMEDQRGERFVHPLQTSEPNTAAIHDIAYPNQGETPNRDKVTKWHKVFLHIFIWSWGQGTAPYQTTKRPKGWTFRSPLETYKPGIAACLSAANTRISEISPKNRQNAMKKASNCSMKICISRKKVVPLQQN